MFRRKIRNCLLQCKLNKFASVHQWIIKNQVSGVKKSLRTIPILYKLHVHLIHLKILFLEKHIIHIVWWTLFYNWKKKGLLEFWYSCKNKGVFFWGGGVSLCVCVWGVKPTVTTFRQLSEAGSIQLDYIYLYM